MEQVKAEALYRLSQLNDGRVYLDDLNDDFDKAMKMLLYAKAEDLATAQGAARALHEQLKKFTDARKVLDAGNLHVAS